MCLEDLRLGRGRVVGASVTVTDSPSNTPALQGNANRVAIVMTPIAMSASSPIGLTMTANSAVPDIGLFDLSQATVVFKIEELGQLITSTLFPSGNGGGLVVRVTEIISNVEGQPISR